MTKNSFVAEVIFNGKLHFLSNVFFDNRKLCPRLFRIKDFRYNVYFSTLFKLMEK